jgi:competence protein ComEA
MSGSSLEPSEAVVADAEIDAVRPVRVESPGERWAVWRREPRLVTAGLALIALAAGAWWVRLSVSEPSSAGSKGGEPATIVPTDEGSVPAPAQVTTSTAAVFVVDVVGAVRHPGVVSLPGSARVVDAVTAAGGAFPNADLERINLAAHLVDGMRVAVPRRGVPTDPAGPTTDPAPPTAAGGADGGGVPTPTAPLDLNAATQAQLEALPGIGPSLAQAIIQERDREGGFHTVDDLRRVRGIGDVRFAQIRPLVTV